MISTLKFSAIPALLCLTQLGQAQQYRVIELPNHVDDRFSGHVIEDDGLVYGAHRSGSIVTPGTWSPSTGLQTWPAISGFQILEVAGANPHVTNVYGAAINAGGSLNDKPVRWSPSTGYVFQGYATGTTGRGVQLRGANDTGTMVGIEVDRFSGGIYGNAIYLPDGTSLTEPQGGYLKDVNNEGYIIGDTFSGTGQRINLRHPNGTWNALPFSGGFGVSPSDISNAGHILGKGSFRMGTNLVKYQPVLYDLLTGNFRVIPTLREYDRMSEFAHVNDSGLVVSGLAYGVPGEIPTQVVEMWTQDSGTRDLDALLDADATALGYHMTDVTSLNNRNEMIGYANQGGRTNVRVLLQPVPEPGTIVVFGVGPLFILLRRARK